MTVRDQMDAPETTAGSVGASWQRESPAKGSGDQGQKHTNGVSFPELYSTRLSLVPGPAVLYGPLSLGPWQQQQHWGSILSFAMNGSIISILFSLWAQHPF